MINKTSFAICKQNFKNGKKRWAHKFLSTWKKTSSQSGSNREPFPLTKANRMIYRAKCSAGNQFVPPVKDLSCFSQEPRAGRKKKPLSSRPISCGIKVEPDSLYKVNTQKPPLNQNPIKQKT